MGELDDAGVQDVLRKEIKQRRDSATEYERLSTYDPTMRVLKLEAYLPQGLSEAEIEAEVRAIISELGASGPASLKSVMPVAIARLKGQAEGRAINRAVTKLLADE